MIQTVMFTMSSVTKWAWLKILKEWAWPVEMVNETGDHLSAVLKGRGVYTGVDERDQTPSRRQNK